MKRILGYTLIELLVAISIIVIFFAIVLASYIEFNRQQIVVQAAQTIVSDLRLTQNKALTGEKVCGPTACGGTNDICDGDEAPLVGWQVEFNGSSYDMYGLCGPNGLTKFNLTTYTLPQNVTIEYPVVGTKMTFKAFPIEVLNPGAIYILSSFNRKYKVEVTGSGEIVDFGVLSPGDPLYIPPVLPTATQTPILPTSIPSSPPVLPTPTPTPRPTSLPPTPIPTSRLTPTPMPTSPPVCNCSGGCAAGCDANGVCQFYTSGERNCPACQTCAGATSSSCVNMAACSKDTEGSRTCTGSLVWDPSNTPVFCNGNGWCQGRGGTYNGGSTGCFDLNGGTLTQNICDNACSSICPNSSSGGQCAVKFALPIWGQCTCSQSEINGHSCGWITGSDVALPLENVQGYRADDCSCYRCPL